MARRFVHQRRGDDDDPGPGSPFTTELHPARTINAALRATHPGDIIEILDAANYAEGELVIDKDLTLVSRAWRESTTKPRQTAFRESSYPRLSPRRRRGRVLRVQGAHLRSVRISGLGITGGRTTNDDGDPAMGAGAGIAIVDMGMGKEEVNQASGLLIEDCYFRDNITHARRSNQTSAAPLGLMFRTRIERLIELIRLTPRFPDEVEGLVGDIETRLPEYFDQFNNPIRNYALSGQSFGAGLGFVWASGRVVGCRFTSNIVTGRGGGIGVSGYGWPLIEDCIFNNNRAVAQTRRDGGGIGFEIAIPDRITRDLKVEHLITDLAEWLSNAGTLDAFMLDFEFQLEVVRYLYSLATSEQPVPNSLDEAINAVMHLLIVAYLRQRKYQLWDRELLEKAKVARAVIRRCRFEGNRATDDGGGLYASVLSRIEIEDSQFNANRAGLADQEDRRGGGGAVRATMGSDTIIRRCTFNNNMATGGQLQVGGGALAFRNVAITIAGSSGSPTTIANNQCTDWAGGGIMISSESSGGGGVLPEWFPDYFTAILTGVFEFQGVFVRINSHVLITENQAGRNRRSQHGKGGGLYLLRGEKIDVPPLHLEVDNYTTNVVENRGTTSDTDDTYHQILLVDLTNGVRVGDDGIRTYLSGSRLRYESGT